MTELRGAVMRKDVLYRIIVTHHTSALVSQFLTPPSFSSASSLPYCFASCAIAPFHIRIGSLLIDTTLEPAIMVLAFSRGILVPFVAFAALRDSAQELLLKYVVIVQKAAGLLLVGLVSGLSCQSDLHLIQKKSMNMPRFSTYGQTTGRRTGGLLSRRHLHALFCCPDPGNASAHVRYISERLAAVDHDTPVLLHDR